MLSISGNVLAKSQPRRAVEKESSGMEIIAKLNHDLRTPLNTIVGFSELMLLGIAGPLTAKQREYMRHIRHNGLMMLDELHSIRNTCSSSF